MNSARECAYNHLKKFPKTSFQIKQFLKKKGFDLSEIDSAIEELQKQNILNDVLYAELYLESEVANKGNPLVAVMKKLYSKGVVQDVISGLVMNNERDYTIGMKKKLLSEWKKVSLTIDPIKWMQRMTRRGYSYHLVKEVIE